MVTLGANPAKKNANKSPIAYAEVTMGFLRAIPATDLIIELPLTFARTADDGDDDDDDEWLMVLLFKL